MHIQNIKINIKISISFTEVYNGKNGSSHYIINYNEEELFQETKSEVRSSTQEFYTAIHIKTH